MAQHLYGNGAARTPTVAEDLAMFESAGFRVEEHYDFANNLGHQTDIRWRRGGGPLPGGGATCSPSGRYFSLLPVHPYPWVRCGGAVPIAASAAARAGLGRARSSAGRSSAARMNEGGDGTAGYYRAIIGY